MLGCEETLVDKDGNNALHVAVLNRQKIVVEFLVKNGHLDKKVKNNFGCTPKDLAKSIGDDEIQEILRSPLKRGIRRIGSMLRMR